MKGLTTDGPCSSTETPITVKPFSAYFFWIATNPGISLRQGGHQVAQKSKMTTLPLKSESFTGFPSTSLNCQSGAAFFESAAWVKSACPGPPSAKIKISFGWYRWLTSCRSAKVSEASGLPAITTCLGVDSAASRATSICAREEGDCDNCGWNALMVRSAI